jgi:hypothetical protein
LSFKNSVAKIFGILSAIGLTGTAVHAQNFDSVSEARSYLANNPDGPGARRALRYIIEQSLRDEYPEFSRTNLSDNYGIVVSPKDGISAAAARTALTGAPTGTPTVAARSRTTRTTRQY